MKKFRFSLNDENAVKKVLLFIAPFLLALLVFAGIKLGSYIKNNEPEPVPDEITEQAPEDEQTTEEEETYSKPEPEELKVEFFGDFVPFESPGDFYSFPSYNNIENRDGIVFKSVDKKGESYNHNAIIYTTNEGDNLLFSINDPNVDIEVVAYIDDALYFNISKSNDMGIDGFYRMWLKYSETGMVIDSGISFRFNKNIRPIKAENNTLILNPSYGEYILFDTQTGEYTPIDYNKTVEYSDVSDKLSIDMNEAMDIAEKELQNNKYYIEIHGEEYEHDHGMKPKGDNTLIYRPDYVYGNYHAFKLDLYPEYAWHITLKGEFWGVVFVNAETGEVTYVSLDYLD